MTNRDDLVSALPGDGVSSAAARLARIKAEAAQRKATRSILGLDDGEVFKEAARGMADRRVGRHDLLGAMLWEAIAEDRIAADFPACPEEPAHSTAIECVEQRDSAGQAESSTTERTGCE